MARDWPTIDERTFHLWGDPHWGRIIMARLDRLLADLARGYEDAPPAMRLMAGDATHYSQLQQFLQLLEWLAESGIPAPRVLAPNGLVVALLKGNHDAVTADLVRLIIEADSYGYAGGHADFTVQTGLPENYVMDSGQGVRVLMLGWSGSSRLSAGQMAWMEDEVSGTSDRIILHPHAPPYGSVGGPTTGRRILYTATRLGFFVDGPTGVNGSEFFDFIAGHDNIDGTFSGHTHTAAGAGLLSHFDVGGRRRFALNASALVWDYPKNKAGAPIRTVYARRDDYGLVAGYRDHGLGTWIGTGPGDRFDRVELP